MAETSVRSTIRIYTRKELTMTTEQILRELRNVKKREEGKHYDTFAINVGAMASDCIDVIEGLQKELEIAREELRKRLRADLRGDICE
jgi:hypothetical protein